MSRHTSRRVRPGRMFRRKLLVLGIHLCACWIGAIVGRPQRPAPARWGRLAALDRPTPAWIGRGALVYALLVTLLSVAFQALALGHQLADLSVAAHISRLHLLVLVLPRALPELVAVFLSFGLFLLEAVRGGARATRRLVAAGGGDRAARAPVRRRDGDLRLPGTHHRAW